MSAAGSSKTPLVPYSLADGVQKLGGIGPKRAEAFKKLGISTVGDLLEYLPARYERRESRTIQNLEEGMVATVIGTIAAVKIQGRWRGRVVATLIDNTGRCTLTWFNARHVTDRVQRGANLRASGRITEYRGLPQMVNPRFEILGEDAQPADESAPTELVPVYPATAELTTHAIAAIIRRHLDAMLAQVHEILPDAILRDGGWMPRRSALEIIHRPSNEAALRPARIRLAYDELLVLQAATTLARRRRSSAKDAPALSGSAEIDRRIRKRFPFSLTRGQDRAISEIVSDLAQRRPMNRLLQGDVGCGKTAVALYAALVAVANRRQVAIMAPTELLARQHFQSIGKYLAGSKVRYDLLIGGLATRQRKDVLAALARGELDLIVGTHALLQSDVAFKDLGLVVIDEQHRFGVRQRAAVRAKGTSPHYLLMTATPIPRTLAMTVFGDLDVTTIDELPPSRTPVQTWIAGPGRHDSAWGFVRSQLAAGRQAYVVYPIIDESDKSELKAATTEFRRLSQRVLSGYRASLLHGRLDDAERAKVMEEFTAGRVQVLVATTVIEVGIDVANASCMIVEHAERYGLSQLHQLRGRIGRGAHPGHCILMTDSHAAVDNDRLAILAQTTDGFRIAEEDLRIRGPGQMLGLRQHGLPELRIADLIEDAPLLRKAQRDAGEIVRDDPLLRKPEHAEIRQLVSHRNREMLGVVGVG